MRQIAIYGKGGIGKSMVSSHITYALAYRGLRVMHVGCDPKHDSTRLLLDGKMTPAILDILKKKDFKIRDIQLEDVVFQSPSNTHLKGEIYCAESGGPEPGSGCSGKGVTEAMRTLGALKAAETYDLDMVLYDVLGDVVCGGFTMPLKRGLAKEIYVVTSGELQSLFAACNLARAVLRYADRVGARLGGIIGNLRDMENERELLLRFAERLGTHVIGFIPYSEKIKAASGKGQTLFQYAPDSPECDAFRELVDNLYNNETLTIPNAITFDELHYWWQDNKLIGA
jgi:nitrogenase iron protein NifH